MKRAAFTPTRAARHCIGDRLVGYAGVASPEAPAEAGPELLWEDWPRLTPRKLVERWTERGRRDAVATAGASNAVLGCKTNRAGGCTAAPDASWACARSCNVVGARAHRLELETPRKELGSRWTANGCAVYLMHEG